MQTRSSLQRRSNSESSDRVVVHIKPRSWGDETHEQPQMVQPKNTGFDFKNADWFSHDPGPRSPVRVFNTIQAKLTVGAPNDQYEQEADRVAEQVMSTPDSAIHQSIQREDATEESAVQTKPIAMTITPIVQREMASEEEDEDHKPVQAKLIQREEALEKEDEDHKPVQAKSELQRKASPAGFQAQPRLEQQLDSNKGGGSPLPDDVRDFMEPRFGADFSQVRVHTDNEAVQMNQHLNAQAFTHKQDLYFGAGKAPANDALTAHELTHVVQQTNGVHMLQSSSDDSSEESWWDRGINWAEGKIAGGAHALAEQAEGIPVLEQVANAGAFVAEQGSQLTGGLLKGAGTMVGGIGNMIAHPVDTAMGLEAMAEHIPVMGAPLKAMHGVYDVAVNGKDPLETANHVLNPLQSLEDDATFYGNVAKGIAKPYQQEIEQGKYAEAVGRGVFDIGSIVLTAGAGAGAEEAATAGRGAAIAGEAADAARVAEGAAVASDATKAAEVGDAANAADKGGDVIRVVEETDNAAHNTAEFEKFKARLAEKELEGAPVKGSALKPDPDHRAATWARDTVAEDGKHFSIKGGDGKTSNLSQVEGNMNGQDGIFEYIVDAEGNLTHQRFIPKGKPVGFSNQSPKKLDKWAREIYEDD